MRRARWTLALALSFAACGPERGAAGERAASNDAAAAGPSRRPTSAPEGEPREASTSSADEGADSRADSQADSQGDSQGSPRAVDDGAASARRSALSEADAALGRGDAAAAIVAADRALAAVDVDAEALVRRGEAHLLAGEREAAEVDLRGALAASADHELRGRAALALGERFAASGDREAAQLAFKEAARLAPSRAAKAKLQGSAVDRACAFVDRSELRARDLADWRALADALALPIAEGEADDAIEAATRAAICGEGGCAGDPPWLVLGTGSLGAVEPRGEGLRALLLPRVDVDLGGDPGGCERSAMLIPGAIPRLVDRASCLRIELDDRCEAGGVGCLSRIPRRLEVVEEHVLRARPLGSALRLRRSRAIEVDGARDGGEGGFDDGIELTLEGGSAVVRGRGCTLKAAVILAQ